MFIRCWPVIKHHIHHIYHIIGRHFHHKPVVSWVCRVAGAGIAGGGLIAVPPEMPYAESLPIGGYGAFAEFFGGFGSPGFQEIGFGPTEFPFLSEIPNTSELPNFFELPNTPELPNFSEFPPNLPIETPNTPVSEPSSLLMLLTSLIILLGALLTSRFRPK